jgi:hypothetical protein
MTLPTPTKKPFPKNILVGIVIIVVVVGVVVATLAVNYAAHPPVSASVVNGQVTVGPGSTKKYTFAVPLGATSAHVSGSFTATGGGGNDIVAYVLDSYGNALYNSGQVSTGNFDVQLMSGSTYSLVFDNTFSTVSTKTVNAQATLNYNQ